MLRAWVKTAEPADRRPATSARRTAPSPVHRKDLPRSGQRNCSGLRGPEMIRKNLQVSPGPVYFLQRPIFGGNNSCMSWIFCTAGASGSRPSFTARHPRRRGWPAAFTSPGEAWPSRFWSRRARSFVLAVLPATSRVDLDRLGSALRAEPGSVRLATPDEIDRIFTNCEPGAIPAFGTALWIENGRRCQPCRRRSDRLRDQPAPPRPEDAIPGLRGAGRTAARRVRSADHVRAGPDIAPETDGGLDDRSKPVLSALSLQSVLALSSPRRRRSPRSSGAKPRRMVFSVMLRVRRNSRR